MEILLFLYVFLAGALVGSFLNVVIHRTPRGDSIVTPRSSCPSCTAPVRWYDNIPLFSWVALGARCRQCNAPISVRYPIVELASATLWVASFAWLRVSVAFFLVSAILSILVALIFIDLDTQLLPNVLTYPALVLGLILALVEPDTKPAELLLAPSFADSLIGAISGAGVIALVSLAYYILRGEEGMGRGDIKMMAMIGAVSGWRAIIPVIFIGSALGAIIGVALGSRQKTGLQVALPFGPFLGIAFLITIFFGEDLYAWIRI